MRLTPNPPKDESPPAGYKQWSPQMTWRSRAIAWSILALILVGSAIMLVTALTGPPR